MQIAVDKMIWVQNCVQYKTWAIINYGWESKKFYKKWFGAPDDDNYYKSMSGVSLDPFPNDPIAHELLKIFKEILKKDKVYAKRIEAHYWKLKEATKEEQKRINKKIALVTCPGIFRPK
jgi:hypothetical protein